MIRITKIALFLSIIIIISCNTSKKPIGELQSDQIVNNPYDEWIKNGKEEYNILDSLKKVNTCNNHNSCLELYNCDKRLLRINFNFHDDRLNKLLSCCLNLSKLGHKDIELRLIDYYDRVYRHSNPNYRGAAAINSGYVHPLSQLRSPEAFEVAMKYARHGQWNDNGDDVGSSHSGINFIYDVIDSMVKEINGKTVWDYFHPDKMFDMGYEIYEEKGAKLAHQYMWNELDKAWKSGKIVLKQYGEE